MGQNYKATLNLPQTDFPMKAGLPTREPEMLRKWEAMDLYAQIQTARAGAELFVLHDGPPFANGDVHMGTALNKILKDLVVKSKTMAGFRAPFVPGWDCHGLPIEYKVVKESRGLSPIEVRRRSAEFARKFIDIQREQFKRLGVFGDWEHPYLTMNPGYEAEILRAFALFVERGLVYKSLKPVFWSTGAQTALAEAEVEYQDRTDTAAWVKFPIVTGAFKNQASILIWTTTPWTLPANLAIAVHPKELYVLQEFRREGVSETLVLADKLVQAFCLTTGFVPTGEPMQSFPGTKLEGIGVEHPFLPRTAIVLAADFVTMDTGTGAVHIAPGHGEDDYSLGRMNGLPILSPVDDHGRFTEEVGLPELIGQYVFDANAEIVKLLRARGMLVSEQPYQHSYPYCWRSKTPIIFRAVEQFFIRIDDLRKEALNAIVQVNWIPPWGENRIAGTVEARPDWVISRQRSWGVPLPVFYSPQNEAILDPQLIRRLADLVAERGSDIWFELDDAALARQLRLPEGTRHRNDTLDVWIDSGVSHFAVCARHPALRDPADMYLEATDQHRGWFQSSLMTSVALHNRAPYKTCVTHGFVVDLDGKKISKSSTYTKPMDAEHFVSRHGADLVRLWVASINYTDDVPFSEEMFTRLGDTYRRIRNTLRILLGNLHDFESGKQEKRKVEFTLVDRWILDRLQQVIDDCRAAYAAYEFHKVYQTLNQFCAVDLSSLYIDITKDRLYCDAPDSTRRRATQSAMSEIFDALCKLLAPILVFTAEEAWLRRHPERSAAKRNEVEGSRGETEQAAIREGESQSTLVPRDPSTPLRFAQDDGRSVHLELFPEPDESQRDGLAREMVSELLKLRGVIGQAIEKARQEKLIGNALEAAVELHCDERLACSVPPEELEEFFILSDLTVVPGAEASAASTRTPNEKCARCWRHRPAVGQIAAHPDLCDRCAAVIEQRA